MRNIMAIDLSKREKFLLLRAMHMSDSEGGWEYPSDLSMEEYEALWTKLGGKFVRIEARVGNKAYNVFEYPHESN